MISRDVNTLYKCFGIYLPEDVMKIDNFTGEILPNKYGVVRRRFPTDQPLYDGIILTQQHFKDECDVNLIVSRFNKTGQMPITNRKMHFGDFSGPLDYSTAMQVVLDAHDAFSDLSAQGS